MPEPEVPVDVDIACPVVDGPVVAVIELAPAFAAAPVDVASPLVAWLVAWPAEVGLDGPEEPPSAPGGVRGPASSPT
jgi:hypothetical protein